MARGKLSNFKGKKAEPFKPGNKKGAKKSSSKSTKGKTKK